MLALAFGAAHGQQRQDIPPVQHQPRAAGSAQAGGGIQAPPLPAARPLSPAERQFVARAARSGHAEVQAGRLALARSEDPGVRQLAERLVDDHTAANVQLRQIARARGMAVPQQPSPRQAAMLQRLQALRGDAFDRGFLAQAGVQMHRQAIRLFEQQAASGQGDAALRNFARETLPGLREHLRMAQSLHAARRGGERRAGTGTAAAGAAASSLDDGSARELR